MEEWLQTEGDHIQIKCLEEILYCDGSGATAQAVHRCCGYPILGSAQGQVGQGPEQFYPVKCVPAHGGGGGQNQIIFKAFSTRATL